MTVAQSVTKRPSGGSPQSSAGPQGHGKVLVSVGRHAENILETLPLLLLLFFPFVFFFKSVCLHFITRVGSAEARNAHLGNTRCVLSLSTHAQK